MRSVHGFDRPMLQWIFVALALVLIAVAGGGAIAVRRTRATNEALRLAALNARLDRQQLEARFAREQSARESFSLELARQHGTVSNGQPAEPTLTLLPLSVRRSAPPEATVAAPASVRSLELRLVLPHGRV